MKSDRPRGSGNRRRSAATAPPGWIDGLAKLGRGLRQLLIVVGVLGGVATVIAGGVGAYSYLDRPLELVRINAPLGQLSRERIQALVGDLSAVGVLSVDLPALRERLEADPWVASVRVQRRWPAQLHIEVEEEAPIARWRDDGILNRRGEALRLGAEVELKQLPHLSGPEGDAREVMRVYRDISELLGKGGLTVREFGVDDYLGIRLTLANGMELVLGRGEAVQRVQRFLQVWRHALHTRGAEIATVDARYHNGLAVAWRQGAAPLVGANNKEGEA